MKSRRASRRHAQRRRRRRSPSSSRSRRAWGLGVGPEAGHRCTQPAQTAITRCASLALAPLPPIFSYKSEKSLCGTGGRSSPRGWRGLPAARCGWAARLRPGDGVRPHPLRGAGAAAPVNAVGSSMPWLVQGLAPCEERSNARRHSKLGCERWQKEEKESEDEASS